VGMELIGGRCLIAAIRSADSQKWPHKSEQRYKWKLRA
jgi:hypothetical protein